MSPRIAALVLGLAVLPPALATTARTPTAVTHDEWGTHEHYADFPSTRVAQREVEVWLPPGYDPRHGRYAVLYMHDGQNLYDGALSISHAAWQVDRHLAALIAAGKVVPTIVVGVRNTAARWSEYAPAAAYEVLSDDLKAAARGDNAAPLSDAYVEFLVTELKPFIDAHYPTRRDPAHTFIMGSSMGGLISSYAMARYPTVYGGAACLSTHWPYTANFQLFGSSPATADARLDKIGAAYIDWLDGHWPDPATHRIWFDHGTAELDSFYAPFQARVDASLLAHGFRNPENFVSREYAGAAHNEAAWDARLDEPLIYLLGAGSVAAKAPRS
jgi:predicted alpha/beta superfamily hydrolase